MPPKKTKYVKLDSAAGASVVLPGRQRCDCLAMKHDLINNCLSCGRIVCVQEGVGPCMFCGEIVMTKEDRLKVRCGNKAEAKRLLAKYSKEAEATKQRLLEYDRSSAQRTRVIDDQSDYFSTQGQWLSPEEKKIMKERQEAYEKSKSRLRRTTKITIDIAGRRIIEEIPTLPVFEDLSQYVPSKPKIDDRMRMDDTVTELMKPEFQGELKKEGAALSLWSNRLQDPGLQEIADGGNCITIQQPYAQLIITGIKRYEGRSWYTPIRGRLWIHAGQKEPGADIIKSTEASYRAIVGDIEFPSVYPRGVLLGCVELLDCIPQEEYLELYPNGEIGDPYVFILNNPIQLKTPIPTLGNQKIFKLESHVHEAGKRLLLY